MDDASARRQPFDQEAQVGGDLAAGAIVCLTVTAAQRREGGGATLSR